MYCTKCGTNNSDSAKFCRKCGELLEAEPEIQTQVAVRPVVEAGMAGDIVARPETRPIVVKTDGSDPDEEPSIFKIGPTLMFVKAGYVLAAVGALLLVAVLSILSVSAWWSVILGLMLFLIPGFYHLRAKLVSYSLKEGQIEVDSGLIGRTTRNIPLRRIQDVTVATSAMQRLLGFGDLVIDNASEEGGKVVLRNINSPRKYADQVLKQMHKLDE
jgi:membrane protein YdbS with pleckstrin-like domain